MKKLIIIEDDTDAREMVVFTFENGGFEVIGSDKELSVQEIAGLKPHIVVIDYMVNGSPGNEIGLKLKANRLTRHIPIILYSPNLNIDEIEHDSCADGFIAKPLELEDFVYLVNRIALS
ncbi:MAG: response regulator [Mucilaginibacter sp.]|nr:response regulator [Mucilaginibacter sp.]